MHVTCMSHVRVCFFKTFLAPLLGLLGHGGQGLYLLLMARQTTQGKTLAEYSTLDSLDTEFERPVVSASGDMHPLHSLVSSPGSPDIYYSTHLQCSGCSFTH